MAVQDYQYFLNAGFLDEFEEEFEVDFDMTAKEITDIGSFNCSLCKKKYKTANGLARHTSHKHEGSNDIDFIFTEDLITTLVSKAKECICNDLCWNVEQRDIMSKYCHSEKDLGILFEEVYKICKDFNKNRNATEFFTSYYANVVANASRFFSSLPHASSTTLAIQLGETILCHLTEKSKNIAKPKPSPITDREIDGLQYLSGYVIHKLLKKTKAKCNYNSVDNQAVISILENAIQRNDSNQILVCVQNRGGLTAVTDNCQQIFRRVEEQFRCDTEINNLRKIDVQKITNQLLREVDIISLFDLICDTDKSGITMIQPEVKYNVLEGMIKLYLRVRSFSLAKDITSRKNAEKKSKALRREIKMSMVQVDDE